jgi:hypothetical protein
MTEKEEKTEQLLLEQRKVKALEKIANSMDALTIWFEEINKDEWSDRLQFYLHEWHKGQIDKQSDFNTKEEKVILGKKEKNDKK